MRIRGLSKPQWATSLWDGFTDRLRHAPRIAIDSGNIRLHGLIGLAASLLSIAQRGCGNAVDLGKLLLREPYPQQLDLRHRRLAGDPSGSKTILSLCPVALAIFLSVRVEGMVLPLSSRAMAVCVVFIRSASYACERFARVRASIRALMRASSSFEIVIGIAISGIAGIVRRVNIARLDGFWSCSCYLPGVPG